MKSIIFFLFTLIVISSCTPDGRSDLEIINKSSIPIKTLTVTLIKEKKIFYNIKPAAELTATFNVRHDSHYHIEVQFEGGEFLEKDVGYFTDGFYTKERVTITRKDIILTTLESKLIE